MTTTTPTDIEALCERLRKSTIHMAAKCHVRLDIWKEHSAVIERVATTLRATAAERDEARAEAKHWHETHLAQMKHDAARVEKLEGMLSACEENSKRLEAIVDANVEWDDGSSIKADRDFLATKEGDNECT